MTEPKEGYNSGYDRSIGGSVDSDGNFSEGSKLVSDYRGAYPNNNYLPITINDADVALLMKSGTQMYHSLFFEIVSITGAAETIQVLGVSEGGVDMHNLFFKQKDNSNTLTEGATLGVGVYEYDGILNVAGVKFVKSAAVAVAVIYGQFSGAS